MIKITADPSKAIAKFQRMERALTKEGDVTLKKLANVGQAFAASIAPRDTGLTASLIKTKKGKTSDWQIVAQNGYPHSGPKVSNFNLPYWMHNSDKAKTHIKSGDRQFMFTTRDYLEGLAGPEARKLVARVTKA